MIRYWMVVVSAVMLMTIATYSVGQQQSPAISGSNISLCKLMAHPEEHLGERVTLQVRMNIFRHGVSITNAACAKLSLLVTSDQEHTESLIDFDRFVAEHRRSIKPLFATVEGRIMKGEKDGFLAKRDFVFRLEAAREMREGSAITQH